MTLFVGSNIVKGNINDGMDVETAMKLGRLLGKVYGSPIAVAMDGRTSNQMLKGALTSGIMSVGCDVMDLGMVPTPLIQYYMTLHPEIKGGVTITASFAGPDINGFRIMKSGGVEDPIFDELTLDSIMNVEKRTVSGTNAGEILKVADFTENYIASILSKVDVDAIRQAGLRICLDCRNSAVASIASSILLNLSINCITIGGDRSVFNDDRLEKLGHLVRSQELDLGVAIEMDADHVLFASSDGKPVSGDKSFAIIAKSILDQNKGKIVIPINSTTLMEDVIRENGGTIIHTEVGEQSMVMKVKENEALLGGDVFGCIVIPVDQVCTCDAMLVMVKMIEIIVKNGPLAELDKSLPDYYIARDMFECPEEQIEPTLNRFREMHNGEKMELVDGIKLFKDDGWILVRHSNVKGVIKIYAQANTKETAEEWTKQTIRGLKID